MTADALSRRRRRHARSASPSANVRSARSWSRAASAASARSCSATTPRRCCATCRTASRGPSWSAAMPGSSSSSPRWSASSRRRASASTCRSTCAARRSSSASGRRCATIPAGATASYSEIARRIGAPSAVRAVAQACARQPAGRRDPLPPRGPQRRRAVRLPLGRRAQARPARARGDGGMNARDRTPARRCRRRGVERIAGIDWPRVAADLDAEGCAMIERLLTPASARRSRPSIRASGVSAAGW